MQWVPEVSHFCPQTKFVLVATKSDRKKDKNCTCVSTEDGKKLCEKIKAAQFIECSAKTGQNVKEVFKEAIDVVKGRADEKEKQGGCVVV